NPTSALEGSKGFTITVNGSQFVQGAIVRLDGQSRDTTFVSSTILTAKILDTDLVGAGVVKVTVFNPPPGGGISTTSVNFTIMSPGGNNPTISKLNPDAVVIGGPEFTLEVNGSNFASGAMVRVGANSRATTFVSANQLKATIPAADIAAAA